MSEVFICQVHYPYSNTANVAIYGTLAAAKKHKYSKYTDRQDTFIEHWAIGTKGWYLKCYYGRVKKRGWVKYEGCKPI